jgi:hypothetical protein
LNEKPDTIADRPTDRRRLFGSAAALVGGAAALSLPFKVSAAGVTDADILNFALNLEYLEAEFYLRAVYGHGLGSSDISGTGTQGDVIGGHAVPFSTAAGKQYATEIANDELAHVKFLRSALGAAKVARPRINLKTSFTNAAIAAGIITQGRTFDPFANEENFLLGAFIFEDVGVTAYKGAAPLIENKDHLAAAAGILAVEAYHAGEIRTLIHQRKPLWKAARLISDLRDAAAGGGDKDRGVVDNAGNADIVPTSANGLAYGRSTTQVLNIVYLGGGSGNFGFFPQRLNGNIR